MDEPNRIRHGLAFHSESGYKHQGAQSLIGHDIGFITVDVPFIFVPGVVEWAKFPQENIKLKGLLNFFYQMHFCDLCHFQWVKNALWLVGD